MSQEPNIPSNEAAGNDAGSSCVNPAPPKFESKASSSSGQRVLAVLLSVFLGIFLADGIISLVDDSLIVFFDIHALSFLRAIVFFFAIAMAVLTYCLIGLIPSIPKRQFLPLTLFNLVAGFLMIPCIIYFYRRIPQAAWIISVCQVALGLGVLFWLQGGFKFRWAMVPSSRLNGRSFSWRHLLVFLLVNVLVLLPVAIFYCVGCAALAVDHFSDGFLTLRPAGLTVQARTYVRKPGETIQLYPMAHVADSAFYGKLSQSFPTNSIILMEGVTDEKELLTNKITYKRMAQSLGVAEQQKEFQPTHGEIVRADVDVEQFTASTIDVLNLVMLFHSKGMTPEVVAKLSQFSPPSHFEDQLLDDLIHKRNQHLLGEIYSRLSDSENIIVPWGVAHMPEIAREIQKSGFRLEKTQDYIAIRFGNSKTKAAGKLPNGKRE